MDASHVDANGKEADVEEGVVKDGYRRRNEGEGKKTGQKQPTRLASPDEEANDVK